MGVILSLRGPTVCVGIHDKVVGVVYDKIAWDVSRWAARPL